MTPAARTLIAELLAARRISSVEAEVLRREPERSEVDFRVRVSAPEALAQVLQPQPQGAKEARNWRLPSIFSPDGIRAWLLELCEFLDFPPSRVASAAGIAPSTLNRFISGGDRDGTGLSCNTVHAIISAFPDMERASARTRAQ